ncbi:MAG: glycosyltransferase family 4 protein [Minisyncoccia bacterium]
MTADKKLLFVITQPVVGGAQKYVFDLAKNLKDKYQVSVACGGSVGGHLFKALASEGINTVHIRSLAREVRILGDLKTFFELIKLFRKERPDIIHLNSSKVGFLGALAAFFYKLTTNNHKPKTIFTAHGWIFKEDMPGWKKKLAVFLEWKAALFKDRIICVSQDDFNQALKRRIAPPRKLYVIHNAVGETKFLSPKNARAEVGRMIGRDLPDNVFVVTNLGRLYANKGLNYLIQAIQETRNKCPNLKLVIFGDGPERQTLQALITNYQLQNTVFLAGDVPEVSKYLAAFDTMVLSSTKEGFPYSILEVGLAGVPVVATDVGGVNEAIKDGKTGILVEPKNSKMLAEAILKLASDRELAKKLTRGLKKTITQEFSFEAMIQKTEWVYKV